MQVADLIGADPREIVWTSGATESINLASKGAAHFYQGKGKHLITLKTEHKAVLDTMRELERQGFEATYLDVQEDGLVNMDALKGGHPSRHHPDQHPVREQRNRRDPGHPPLVRCAAKRVSLLHVDAAQATGRVEIDMNVPCPST